MKYLRQFLIIIMISLIGEVMHYFIPLPVPASIYGMAILFVGLVTKIIPLDYVKDAGKLMIEIMPVMFIPAGVGLMASFGVLKPMIIPFCVVLIVTVVTVIIITGHVSQFIIKSGKKKNKENEWVFSNIGICGRGLYTKLDLGIVKYHFEVVSGKRI